MADKESLGEIISTDVLIMGGGLGSLITAIKIKETNPNVDVLIVEKQTTGYAGKANRGGGVVWVMAPDDDMDEFLEYHVKNIGHYLEDQELLYSNAAKTLEALEQVEKWGAYITRKRNGTLDYLKLFKHWSLVGIDHGLMLPLRRRARQLGARTIDKVALIDLLKYDDRVVGALGFNIVDGRFYTIKAKATVVANGSCNYMVTAMWSSGRGDGIAATYRAGSEMRNAEFGNFYNMTVRGSQSVIHGGQFAIYNNKGERLAEKYCAEYEPDLDIGILLGMEKEVLEGRGPIVIAPLEAKVMMGFAKKMMTEWKRPISDDFLTRLTLKEFQYTPDKSPMPETIPGFIGELSCIKVDHEMKTSVPGLWAIGDACAGGSAWAGAVPAPPGRMRGAGIMNTLLSALRAGPSVADFASSEASPPEFDSSDAQRMKEDMFAPMKCDKGYLPAEVARTIGKIVSPAKYSIRKSKERLEEALAKVDEIKWKLPELSAKDFHGLCFCNEVKSMTLCAELYFRSALYRTESRGWHYRKDFPKRDDKNWLSWTILKRDGEKMAISSLPVPIDKYRIKP